MIGTRLRALGLAAGFLVALPPSAGAQPQRLTFADAVRMSAARSPDIAGARHGVTAANLRVTGTSAQRYPKLRTEANLIRWDNPLRINLVGNGMPGMDTTFVARDQITTSLSISLAQPISGLFVLHRVVAMERHGADAARSEVDRARLDITQRAAEAYLRLLQARAVEELASKSLAQIEAQLARARTMEQAGVLGKVDVLRWTSSRDSAQLALVRAGSSTRVATGALALALALRPEVEFIVADDFPEPPPPLLVEEPELLRAVEEARPEVEGARARTRQAKENKTVAAAQLLPNLMGVATYQHIQGQGPFQPRNAWFIGATLTWDLWDWGKTWDGMKEAGARASQAVVAETIVRDQIAFEARRRLIEAKAAFESLAPARSAQDAMEEAYRIQGLRYDKGVATTTDVIDAETDLARARTAYAQARFDYFLAQAALARAVGAMPGAPAAATSASRRSD